MTFSLEHLGLPARDPQALAEWYIKTLGLRRHPSGNAALPIFVGFPGGPMLEIGTAAGSVPQTGDNGIAGFRHLALRVASIEAARKELETRGVKFTEPVKPAAGGGSVLFFTDCEGNLIHLVERPPGSAFA
jgi:glyoxylase I family protein